MKKIEIDKIVVKIGDKKIELSLDEARELESALHDLLHTEPHYVPCPSTYPDWWLRPYVPCWPHWKTDTATWTVNGTGPGGATVSYTLLNANVPSYRP